MLNINELESRWLTYKIKSFIPHAIIFISVIVIVVASTFIEFSTQERSTTEVTKIQKDTPQATPVVVAQQEIKTPLVIPTKEIILPEKNIYKGTNTQQVIQPSLGFLNNIKENTPQFYQEELTLTPEIENKEVPRLIQKPKKVVPTYVKAVKKEEIVEEEIELETVQPSTISIHRQNTHQDIQHVIKRFKKSNNPALSLFVAKKYYELNNYKQAYNYALITNEINSDIEQSWLIVAKSLVKLGKKNRALTILNKYISNSHSQRAEILLDAIKSGKMR